MKRRNFKAPSMSYDEDIIDFEDDKQLYFVESIKRIPVSEYSPSQLRRERRNNPDFPQDPEAIRTIATLLYIPTYIDRWVRGNQDFRRFEIRDISDIPEELVREGEYVYYSESEANREYAENGGYSRADYDDRVFAIAKRSEQLFAALEDNVIRESADLIEPSCRDVSDLFSVHVNVGHGNLSFIAFKSENGVHVWVIDCSNFDICAKRYNNRNIDEGIRFIMDKFFLDTPPHIDVAMLTHPHYDHYSGFCYLMDKGIIDKDTVFYINLHYRVKSHNFNNLLTRILQFGAKVIIPVVSSSNRNICILYPTVSQFPSKLSPNNISSVFNLCFNGILYFVFPGDIETEGWMHMGGAVQSNLLGTRYYAVSHHGSITGHFLSCMQGNYVNCVCNCLPGGVTAVLMGRDKAFNGIYSSTVINDFGRRRLLYSEKGPGDKPAKFLAIDLLSGNATWR